MVRDPPGGEGSQKKCLVCRESPVKKSSIGEFSPAHSLPVCTGAAPYKNFSEYLISYGKSSLKSWYVSEFLPKILALRIISYTSTAEKLQCINYTVNFQAYMYREKIKDAVFLAKNSTCA